MRRDGDLEVELAQANLALYVRLTPMEEIQWPAVAAELDRLERLRDQASGAWPVAGDACA